MKRRRLIIAIAFAMAVIVIFILMGHTGDKYLTVSELRQMDNNAGAQLLSVKGNINPGTIYWDNENRTMRFALTDSTQSIDVFYHGTVPEGFKPGAEMAVEGKYLPDGSFEAVSFSRPLSLCAFCH